MTKDALRNMTPQGVDNRKREEIVLFLRERDRDSFAFKGSTSSIVP